MCIRPLLLLLMSLCFFRTEAQELLLLPAERPAAFQSVSATAFQLDRRAADSLLRTKPERLLLPFPIKGMTDTLVLERVRLETPDFRVKESGTSSTSSLPDYLAYRGSLRGQESLSAFVLTEGSLRGVVFTRQEEYSLGPAHDSSGTGLHFLRAGKAPPGLDPIRCDVLDNFIPNGLEQRIAEPASIIAKCVRLDFEIDDELTAAWGGVKSAEEKFLFLFNAVTAIYVREKITLRLSQLKIWTTPAPYRHGNSEITLNSFSSDGGPIVGNVAHLLHLKSEGGRGFIDGRRAVEQQEADISSSPYYSYNVYIIAHELGHNLGSPHTHNCNWPGGAIDNCASTEGGCAPGAAPIAGGTIMSYCNQTTYGINFMNGFGSLPGNLIREHVTNNNALTACSDPPTCTESILQNTRVQTDGRAWNLRWTPISTALRIEERDTIDGPFGTIAELPPGKDSFRLAYPSLCLASYHELRLTPICDGSGGVPLVITLSPDGVTPLHPIITQQGNLLYLQSPVPNAIYRWYADDQPISNTGTSLIANRFGRYRLQETLGPCSHFSNTLALMPVDHHVFVFPNPSGGLFSIQSSGENDRLKSLHLYDTRGRLIKQFIVPDLLITSIDLSGFAPGVYFLRIDTGGNTAWARLLHY